MPRVFKRNGSLTPSMHGRFRALKNKECSLEYLTYEGNNGYMQTTKKYKYFFQHSIRNGLDERIPGIGVEEDVDFGGHIVR